MKLIELHLAFVFDCDDCGRENFVRSITGDFSEEELQELREEHGVEVYELGEWHTRPGVVKCKFCGSDFLTAEGPK